MLKIASATLSLTDALSLLKLSNQLAATTNTTINDLISKKSIIDTAGQDAFVLTQLTAVKGATQGFIAAIVSHVPAAVQSIAQNRVRPIQLLTERQFLINPIRLLKSSLCSILVSLLLEEVLRR